MEAADSLEPELTDGREPLSVCWELNLVPLEEPPVLLTAEPLPADRPSFTSLASPEALGVLC